MKRLVGWAVVLVAGACVAVPEPSSTSVSVSTTSETTSPAALSTTTTTSVADEGFSVGIGVDCVPEFDPIFAEHVSGLHCPDYGIPEQASLFRLIPPTSSLIPLLATESSPPLGEKTAHGWEIVVSLATWVTWSDGSVVDADDVVYSFDVMKGTRLWGLPGSALRSVEEIDPRTVRLVWDRRPTIDEWQLAAAIAPIVSKDFWSAQPDREQQGFPIDDFDPTAIPTTGAYRLAVFDPVDGWVLEAVPGWWESGSSYRVWANGAVHYRNPQAGLDETYGVPGGEVVAEWTVGPYASRIKYHAIGDVHQRRFALSEGVVDMLFGPTSIGLASETFPLNASGVVSPSAPQYWLAFDTRHPPFDTLGGRTLAACALDPDHLVNNVFDGALTLTQGWGTGLGSWFAETHLRCPTTTVFDFQGHLIARIYNGVSRDPIAATTGLWTSNWLSDLGADSVAGHIEPGEEHVFGDWVGTPPGQFAILSTPLDRIRLVNDLDLIPEVTFWESAEYESHREAASDANTLSTAQTAYRAMQQLLADDLPAVPLFHRTRLELFKPTTISPPFLTPDGDRYTTPLLGGLQNWTPVVLPALRKSTSQPSSSGAWRFDSFEQAVQQTLDCEVYRGFDGWAVVPIVTDETSAVEFAKTHLAVENAVSAVLVGPSIYLVMDREGTVLAVVEDSHRVTGCSTSTP